MNLQAQKRNLYAFGFAATFRITDAVWVVLLAARGYALWQVGLAEGVFHIVGLLCEVPSGMLADLMGRRRSMAAAGVCGLAAALLMAFADSFWLVCLSMVFSSLACTLISGSDEALLYDSLVQADKAQEYLKTSAVYIQAQNAAFMLCNALSGLVQVLGHVGIYLVDAAVCLVRVITALRLTEPVVTQKQAARTADPFEGLGRRLAEHVALAYHFLRANLSIARLLLADGMINVPGYLTLMFLQQRLTELGVPTLFLGLPVMLITLGRMLGTALAQKLPVKRLRRLYAVLALAAGLGTVCAGAAPLVPAILGAMLCAAAQDAWMLHEQRCLNERFPSDQRATLISVNAMAYSLLMIAASPLTGWIGDLAGSAGAGLCALGMAVAASGIYCAVTLRQQRS